MIDMEEIGIRLKMSHMIRGVVPIVVSIGVYLWVHL